MSNLKESIHISLTGHRPNKLGGYNLETPEYKSLQKDLEDYILFQLQTHQTVVGHSGLALGGDTIWSKAILAMKDRYPDRVQFHAEIPLMTQSSVWFGKKDKDFWQHQVDNADFKSVYGSLDGIPETQQKRAAVKFMDDRNIGMLDHGDILLAIWDGSKGGTGNAVTYGRKIEMPIIVIDPKRYFK